MLTVGSLFSGIGGLDLGLERAGMSIRWHSEIDPYACKVLKKHWPEVANHGDIKQIDWRTVEPVDVICGGYPCQPFSTAGKRRGTDDPRHLWPWVRDAISALRPRYAILENVRGHLSMGGTTVIGELAEIGYDAEWRVVSAAGLGAPHRRDRIIIVAYPDDPRGGTLRHGTNAVGSQKIKKRENVAQFGISGRCEVMADTTGEGLERAVGPVVERLGNGFAGSGVEMAHAKSSTSRSTQSHGLRPQIWQTTELRESNSAGRPVGDWWQVEPDVGRVADGIPSRVDRLRGLGNAVVPQVAEYIGRLVMAAELDNA